MSLRRAILTLGAHDAAASLLRPLRAGVAPILMMHRFADSELGVAGHSPRQLRENVTYLRRVGYTPVSLTTLLDALTAGDDRLGRWVVFTVDDGYADFARIAAPVFAELDCPVTVFLVSGALDGLCWYWWDRVTASLEQTTHKTLRLELDDGARGWSWSTPAERELAAQSIIERLKLLPDAVRRRTLDELVTCLEVELPTRPPPRFGPMTWRDVRECGDRGVTFGAHTVTHPILSRTTDESAAHEIRESWRRVRAECAGSAVGVFCYPNGDELSFGDRECALLEREGLLAALTTQPAYVSPRAWARDSRAQRFRLPRFLYHDDQLYFAEVLTGVERLKRVLRGD